MKKTIILLAVVLCLLTGCGSGLPQGREMNDMALMRTMGVDAKDIAGRLTVTVSSGRRARGVQGEGQAPLILSTQRASVGGACLAMQNMGDSYVFYGHIDQLLLGEDLARESVMEPLEHFAQDTQLGLGAQVWLIRGGTAEDAIRGEKEDGAEKRLSVLRTDAELALSGATRRAGEALSDLLETGCTYLPALNSVQEGDQKNLLPQGYGIIKDGKLLGWLEGESARGLELMQGKPGAEALELSGATVRLTRSKLTCLPVIAEGSLTGLELDLRLTARVETLHDQNAQKEELEDAVADWVRGQVESALARLQEWDADALSLSRMAGSARPERWRLIREQWPGSFDELETRVRCTVTVSGELL